MTVKRVIFMRPGETNWNREGRWQGWVAAPLNAHGRRQVQALAHFIRNIGMAALYSSDLKRAKETAELLAERLGYAPIYDARLRERNIGLWQGLTLDEMRKWYPEDYETLQANPVDFRVPGGESRAEVRDRMLAAFNDIVEQAAGETVGIISHTTAIRMLLTALLPDFAQKDVDLSNTSVTTIARDAEGKWRIVAADDVTHLEGLPTMSVVEVEEE